MNAVIYARFSSDRQREESIEGQLRECREYAEANGITIVGEYIDRALSASKETEKRLDFLRMIKDSSKHLFDLVLVWKLDRFARNRYDSAHYKAILKKNGVKVVSVTERIADGADGVILEAVLEGMAEYYSLDLSEKIHRGQKENALKAQCNGGRIPFGYQLINHRLEKNPFTAPIVQEVFSRYANGDTVRSIVDDLNQRGIKSNMGYPFTYSSFGNLLKNRTYIGEFHYDGVIIPDGVPALVSKELFERAQIRREKNKHAPAMAKAKENYILTTKLFCGMCGKMMAGESGQHGGKTYRYYKCSGAKRKMGCTKKAVKKEWIENLVVQQNQDYLDYNAKKLEAAMAEDLTLGQRFKNAFPALLMPVIILGGIYSGVMTPTEAAAVAVIYAIPIGFLVYKGLTLKGCKDAFKDAGITAAVVMFMMFMVMILSRLYVLLDLPNKMVSIMSGMTDSKIVVLLLVNIFMVIIGMLMDDNSGTLLCGPILLPLVVAYGVSPIQFAAILGVNLGMGTITPPAAPLLYLGARTTKVPVKDMLKPSLKIILFAWIPTLILTTYIPQLSLFLPRLFGFNV